MLKKWLPKDEIDLIPEYPYTFVGVGGLLIKDNKVLMVKERYAISSKWKLMFYQNYHSKTHHRISFPLSLIF